MLGQPQDTSLAVQQGGLGLDFGSKLFQLKPATLNINQPSTQAEGATRGLLRVSETGDQFEELFVTLLTMPVEQRQYYVGEPGQLNRSPENLHCFSRDMLTPDLKARYPQSPTCASCPKASWDKWRESHLKSDIPPCDAFYLAYLIDTKYQTPLKMYFRSTTKKPFEQGMQQLARVFNKIKVSTGKVPNVFDIGFRLGTKMVPNGKNQSWIPTFSDFRAINDEERSTFGDIYLQFVNRGVQSDEEAQAQAQAASSAEIDRVIDAEYVDTPATTEEIVL